MLTAKQNYHHREADLGLYQSSLTLRFTHRFAKPAPENQIKAEPRRAHHKFM